MADSELPIVGAAFSAIQWKVKGRYQYVDDAGKAWEYRPPAALGAAFAFAPASGLGLPLLVNAAFVPRKTICTFNGEKIAVTVGYANSPAWTGAMQVTIGGITFYGAYQLGETPSQAAPSPPPPAIQQAPESTGQGPVIQPARFTYVDNAGKQWSFRQNSFIADQIDSFPDLGGLPPLSAGNFRPRQIRYVALDGSQRFLVTVWNNESDAWLKPPLIGWNGKLNAAYEWLDETPDQADVLIQRSLPPAFQG